MKKPELEARVRELEGELAGYSTINKRLQAALVRCTSAKQKLEDKFLAGVRSIHGETELKQELFKLHYNVYLDKGLNEKVARKKADEAVKKQYGKGYVPKRRHKLAMEVLEERQLAEAAVEEDAPAEQPIIEPKLKNKMGMPSQRDIQEGKCVLVTIGGQTYHAYKEQLPDDSQDDVPDDV